MAKQSVASVSLDEINETRSKYFSAPRRTTLPYDVSEERNKKFIESQKTYVQKLKDDEVENFFKPFDLIFFERLDDGKVIRAVCDNFTIFFSDFDTFVAYAQNNPSQSEKSQNDWSAFVNYCFEIETTPEKAIGDFVQTKLLGQRFHSYQKSYAQQKDKQRKTAFDALPKTMQKQFGMLDEKRAHEIESFTNKLKYDQYAGDPSTMAPDTY